MEARRSFHVDIEASSMGVILPRNGVKPNNQRVKTIKRSKEAYHGLCSEYLALLWEAGRQANRLEISSSHDDALT